MNNVGLALAIAGAYLFLTSRSANASPFSVIFGEAPFMTSPDNLPPTQPKPAGASTWMPPASADPYLKTINQATVNHKLPPRLLGRLLFQESRFRPDIITGKVKSSAGAIGIAQIIPKWHPNVNPYDANASIHYAGFYLAQLQKQFGNWRDALAAYNWGPGNLTKFKKGQLKTMPKETVNYVNEITRDVPV